MVATEIFLIAAGVICVVVSVVMSFGDDKENVESSAKSELTQAQLDMVKHQVDEVIKQQISGLSEKTEAALDKISNTKILEMNEYAESVLGEINRNHNEAVFLYDMLNEKSKEVKTNAMRMLDRAKVSYTYEEYECDDFTDGIQTADKLGYDHKLVYKTLVTTGKTGNHYVFVIPIEAEIDFKKAAKVVGEKSLEMLHLKDLTKVTGYVRGGCTAIGMKKQFPTVIQEDAKELEYMHVSGGKLGMQIRLAPLDLQKVAKAEFADVIRP